MTRFTLVAVLSICLLAGCRVFTPYQQTIVQGVEIKPAQIESLKVGMTEAQVMRVLGAPVLTHVFDRQHWSYVSTIQAPNEGMQTRQLMLSFKGGRLAHIETG